MRGLILLGGDAPDPALTREWADWAEFVIAADAGLICALDAGIMPDVAVGDFDSTDEEGLAQARAAKCEIISLPRAKDQTDGQEALDNALARGCTEIALLGGFGGRLDHQFAHLCLLVRALRRGARAFLLDRACKVECFGPGVARVSGESGDLLSILPFGDGLHVTKVEGLLYPIDDKPMPLDVPYGISNVFIANEASITIRSGTAIIIIQNRTSLFYSEST